MGKGDYIKLSEQGEVKGKSGGFHRDVQQVEGLRKSRQVRKNRGTVKWGQDKMYGTERETIINR